MSLIHRAGTAILTAALAVTLVAGSATARSATARSATTGPTAGPTARASAPAQQGAGWLARQLTHGVIHNGQFHFDDYGLTLDTAGALRVIGGHPDAIRRVRKVMAAHVSDYTTDASFGLGDVFAGAVAKLLVFAQESGGGARHFGGTDLVSSLDGMVAEHGAARGRIQDVVDPSNTFGDSANAIGQILAVRALIAAHDPLSGAAVTYLLKQQCGKGYFRLALGKATAAHQSCTSKSPVDNDVTSLAVLELWKYRSGHSALRSSLGEAVSWLTRHQAANGSLGGGPSTAAANTNSTGLAGWALGVAGRCGAASHAARWVGRHQVTGDVSGTPLARERGAIAYNHGAMKTAEQDGITKTTRDQWRRATAQAAPALRYLSTGSCRSR